MKYRAKNAEEFHIDEDGNARGNFGGQEVVLVQKILVDSESGLITRKIKLPSLDAAHELLNNPERGKTIKRQKIEFHGVYDNMILSNVSITE